MDPRAGVPAGISGALTSSDGRPVDRDDDARSESKAGRLARLYPVLTAVNRVVQLASDEESLLTSVCQDVVDVARFRMSWVRIVDGAAGVVVLADANLRL